MPQDNKNASNAQKAEEAVIVESKTAVSRNTEEDDEVSPTGIIISAVVILLLLAGIGFLIVGLAQSIQNNNTQGNITTALSTTAPTAVAQENATPEVVAVTPTATPAPTNTPEPTATATPVPTEAPTPTPTVEVTAAPTATAEVTPTAAPTPEPTQEPTPAPAPTPAPTPTPMPTEAPTPEPTATATPAPANNNETGGEVEGTSTAATSGEPKKTTKYASTDTMYKYGNDYKFGDIKGTKYTVKKGDTLWQIAEARYGSGYAWSDINKANGTFKNLPNGNPVNIPVGYELTLPELN